MKPDDPLAVALAALEMCEALILTLVEKGVLTREDAAQSIANARDAKRAYSSEEGAPSGDAAAAILTDIEVSVLATTK